MELQSHERVALTRILRWGDDPAVEADVERIARLHEAALAERPEDDAAASEGGR